MTTRLRSALRTGTLTLALTSVVPAVVGQTGLLPEGFAEGEAHAQPADAVTEVARQRYKEGVKLFEAGKFEDARAAFLQAYALKRVPAVLFNIGQSELRTAPPHLEDAGNHLTQFVREHTTATPDERAAAEKGIADVKRKTGSVQVAVDAFGADIAVDGTLVGKSPLPDPVFVKVGKHVVTATLNGKTATQNAEAKLGMSAMVTISMAGAGAPIAIAPPPVAPGPAMPPPPAGALPLPPPSAVLPPPGGQPDQGADGEKFWRWYGRKPLAWVGTGLTVVGFAGGTIFSIRAAVSAQQTNDMAAKIEAAKKVDAPCATGNVQPGFEAACQTLLDDKAIFQTDVTVAVTGWVVMGVGALGTLTYALVDWKPKKKTTTGDWIVVPIASPTERGIGVLGTF